MTTTPANVIACLSGELEIEHFLIIDLIKSDEVLRGLFRSTVEDFTKYPRLLAEVGGNF